MEINHLAKRGHLGPMKNKQDIMVHADKMPFAELFSKRQEQLDMARVQHLIEGIDKQGKLLANSQNIENLRQYKKLVRELLNHTVKHGLGLEERHSSTKRGRLKIHKIISEIDKKLLNLTESVLSQEEKGLNVLGLIDEIKGLLVNIYI